MKKLFLTLLLCIMILPYIGNALVKPSKTLYVTDEANVLKKETEEYMTKSSDYLSLTNQIHYYVVTVPNLENYTMDQYSDYVFKNFHMGKKGVLIFFSKEENSVQVILGSSLSNIITDEELDNYINDYFIAYFKNMEWDKGLKNGYKALYKKICDYYKIDSSKMSLQSGNDFFVKYRMPILTGVLFLGIILGYTLCNFFKRIYRRKLKSFFDFAFFGIVFVLNIVLLIASYYFEVWLFIMILVVQFLTMLTLYDTSKSMTLEEAFIKIKKEEARKKKKSKKKIIKKKKSL